MKPGRPEEALERLIVHSNPGSMFGQMSIRGGKESVDIVRLRNKVGTFIELKPWKSKIPHYTLFWKGSGSSSYKRSWYVR